MGVAPEAMAGSQAVPWTARHQIQRSRDAAQATRALPRRADAAAAAAVRGTVPGPAAGAVPAVMAAYLAARTGLWVSMGQTARQTARRRPGRPRREILAWPSNAPEEFWAGDIPACLTREEEES